MAAREAAGQTRAAQSRAKQPATDNEPISGSLAEGCKKPESNNSKANAERKPSPKHRSKTSLAIKTTKSKHKIVWILPCAHCQKVKRCKPKTHPCRSRQRTRNAKRDRESERETKREMAKSRCFACVELKSMCLA